MQLNGTDTYSRTTPSGLSCTHAKRAGVIVTYTSWHLNAGGMLGAVGDARSSGHAVVVLFCDTCSKYSSRGHGYDQPAGIGTSGMTASRHQKARMYVRALPPANAAKLRAYMTDNHDRPEYQMFVPLGANKENCTTFAEQGLRVAGLSNALSGSFSSANSPYQYTFRFLPGRWTKYWNDALKF